MFIVFTIAPNTITGEPQNLIDLNEIYDSSVLGSWEMGSHTGSGDKRL